MTTENIPHEAKNRPREWARIFRPLFWWLLLVLVLYGIRTHQRLLAETKLRFEVTLNGRTDYADATVDGAAATSGQLISLGRHEFTITHPKGETFSTNLFIWYGGIDMGSISLKRRKGVLAVSANPAARYLSIRGPEYGINLTNSWGITSSVPTDEYVVEAYFKRSFESELAAVSSGETTLKRLNPKLGIVSINGNQRGLSFTLAANGKVWAEGSVPGIIDEIPAGLYDLSLQHKENRRKEQISILAGETNVVQANFSYGRVVLRTEPAGVTIYANREELGLTPLTLPEVPPGNWKFTFEKQGYDIVAAALEVKADQTTQFETNLVKSGYSSAMRQAKAFLAAGQYFETTRAASEALSYQPDDPEAIKVMREGRGFSRLSQAEQCAATNNFAQAITEVKAALETMPGNTKAQEALASYTDLAARFKERTEQERATIPKEVFTQMASADGSLFESHELTTTNNVGDVLSAIGNAFRSGSPAFRVIQKTKNMPQGAFGFFCTMDLPGGQRRCLIGGAQTKESETRILFEVLEYQNKRSVDFDGGLTVNLSYIPLHPSKVGPLTEKAKLQIAEGLKICRDRIYSALPDAKELPVQLAK